MSRLSSHDLCRAVRACRVGACRRAFVGSASNAVAARSPEPPGLLVILGDSLSAGYGIALDQGWVSLLQARIEAVGLPHQVVNASISGDTTAVGWRVCRAAGRISPGGAGHRVGCQRRPARLLASADRGRADRDGRAGPGRGQSRCCWSACGCRPTTVRLTASAFNASSRMWRRDQGVALTAQLLDGVAEVPELMQADGLHPRASAQPRLLDNLWPDLLAAAGDGGNASRMSSVRQPPVLSAPGQDSANCLPRENRRACQKPSRKMSARINQRGVLKVCCHATSDYCRIGFRGLDLGSDPAGGGFKGDVTVVSPRAEFVYYPGLIWVPSGLRSGEDLRLDLKAFFRRMGVSTSPPRPPACARAGAPWRPAPAISPTTA
jgi:acyl-CoA thioesterase-1